MLGKKGMDLKIILMILVAIILFIFIMNWYFSKDGGLISVINSAIKNLFRGFF